MKSGRTGQRCGGLRLLMTKGWAVVELIVLWILCKRMAVISKTRGRDPRGDCVVLVMFWIGGEIVGGIFGVYLTGSVNILAYLIAGGGAVLGSSIAFNRARAGRRRLTGDQLRRVRLVYETLREVDTYSFERRSSDILREGDPERELRRWEWMASAYRSYCDEKQLDLGAKRDVYQIVLLRSMMPGEKVMGQLRLRVLSADEARTVLEQIGVIGADAAQR